MKYLSILLVLVSVAYTNTYAREKKSMNSEKKKVEYPVFTPTQDKRGYPAFNVFKEPNSRPIEMNAREVLAFPKYQKPESAKELAVLLNHHFQQYEYDVILDIEEFSKKIKERFAAEDPNKPFNPHQQQLNNFGMPDLDSIKEPSFDGKTLTFFASSSFLAGFPYKVDIEIKGTRIGDAHYNPVGTVTLGDDGKPIRYEEKEQAKIKPQKGQPKVEFIRGDNDKGLAKINDGQTIPAKDLLKHYPELKAEKNATLLAEWVMNYNSYHKKSKYYWVIIDDPADVKNRMEKLLTQYKPFADSVKDREPRKLGIRFGYQSLFDYRKIDFDIVHVPRLEGNILSFWTRERDEALDPGRNPSEVSIRQCINYLMGANYNEVRIKDDGTIGWESFKFNEYIHLKSKEPLEVTYSVDRNGWPSFKLTRAGYDIYIVSSKKLIQYPELIQEKYAKELAGLINHTAHSKDYKVIDDPKEFEKSYTERLKKEDPNARYSGTFLLRDYDRPDFSKIKAPQLKNNEVTFFATRNHQNKPPYYVKAVLDSAGRVQSVNYTRMDMM